jgi:hypothetical protein
MNSSAYWLCHEYEKLTHRSSEGCSAGLDFQSVFSESDDKIVSVHICPAHSKNAQFEICMGEDSGQYERCAEHCCQTNTWACLLAGRLGLRPTDANTWAMLGSANWGRPTSRLFTRERAFFTPLPYPSTDWIWRWGCMLSHFVAKSALKLCNGPRPNKQFHTIHTFSNSPNAPRRLNSKVTALVKTHARHDTLTEKRVTKILKCFTTSAGPVLRCQHVSYWPTRSLRKHW